MATHSSILAWRIPWTEEPGGLHPWGLEELDTTERLMHTQKKKKKKKKERERRKKQKDIKEYVPNEGSNKSMMISPLPSPHKLAMERKDGWMGRKSTAVVCRGVQDFTGGARGKESASQGRRHKKRGFHPQVGKIPWQREWQPTPVFLPGKSHGQMGVVRCSS